MISKYDLASKSTWGKWEDTGAAIVDINGTSAIDGEGQYTTLAIAGVGVCLHSRIEAVARGVGVELDCGRGGDGVGVIEIKRDWSKKEKRPGHGSKRMGKKQRCCLGVSMGDFRACVLS